MVATVLLLIGLVAGTVWKMVGIERCYDSGGIVVGPLMRDQVCEMPEIKRTVPSSRP